MSRNHQVCFNCRLVWDPASPPAPVPIPPFDAMAAFSTAEIERLCVYRAAVQAGFYTDALADEPSAVLN